MAKICMNEKTVRRQQEIEEGLLKLMLEEKFERITVTDLCEHLGLARRSFYRYFDNLEDVLNSAMERLFQDMVQPSGNITVEEITRTFRFWEERKIVLTALDKGNLLDKFFEYTMRYSDIRMLQKLQTPEGAVPGMERETAMFLVGGMVAMMTDWYRHGFEKTPEQMAELAYRFLFRRILKEQ